MAWDYAELSKVAKENGGPEEMLSLVRESGIDIGHKEMLPVVGIGIGIGALGYAGISRLVNLFKNKEEISPEAIETAKKELINGIEEYDATHCVKDRASALEEGGEINE